MQRKEKMGFSSQLDFIRSLLLRLHSFSKRKRHPNHRHTVGCVGRLRSLNIPTLSSLRSWREEPLEMSRSSRRKKRNKKQQSFGLGFGDEVFVSLDGIPPEEEEFARFTAMHPSYLETLVVDELRDEEYGELQEDGRVCLDYSGYGLFSQLQQELDLASSSFAISYISGDLSIQALYGEPEEGTVEFDIRRRVMRFLNIQEGEYSMVFTASKGSAFKLLAESYPFDAQRSLLTMFDYESDAVGWMEEIAQRQGAQTLSASFKYPSLTVCSVDLKAQILHKKMDKEKNKKKVEELERIDNWEEKKKKKKKKMEQGGLERKKRECKGLFVFPVQSRITGTKYSYQWMSLAQDNGWHVLLDASALGPKDMDTLGLSLFRPDFIVTSFYKVFGSDPTGFGCLFVKNSSMGILRQSSAARGIGMVRLIPFPGMSSPNSFTEASREEDEEISPQMDRVQGGFFPEKKSIREEPEHAEVAFSGPVSTFFKWRQPCHVDTSNMNECLEKSGKENESGVEDSPSLTLSKNAPQDSTHDQINDVGMTLKDGPVDVGKGKILITPRSVLEERVMEGQGQSFGGKSLELDKSIGRWPTRQEVAFHCFEPGEASCKESTLLYEESLHGPEGAMQSTLEPIHGPQKALDRRLLLAYRSQQIAHGADSSTGPGAFSQPLISPNIKHNFSLAHSEGSSYYAGSQDDLEFSSSLFDKDEQSSEFDIADDVYVIRREPEIYCRGLNHADSLGLNKTNDRLRFLINWLISSMLKLQHLVSNEFIPLVHVYGPKVKYDRGASLAFNLFDCSGSLIKPVLVQQLADRNNISLGMGVLSHIRSLENCTDLQGHLEPHHNDTSDEVLAPPRFRVVTAALGFFTNFQDVYRLWAFMAKFLDAEFVKQEMCCYHTLNQEQVIL